VSLKQSTSWNLEITKKAEKQIAKLPKIIQKRIFDAFDMLTTNPYSGKKLRGEHSGFYRYPIGNYRILYSLEHERIVVVVVKISPRKDAYKLPL
jgi:mRNA interferase RelE/StbE